MSLFMTPREIAGRWSCSPGHVRRLCASGALPAMQLGLRKWRIAVAAVEAFEALHSAAAPDVMEARTAATLGVSTTTNLTPVPAGFDLPPGYEPVFPAAWGMTNEEAASRAAGRGRTTGKRKHPSAVTKGR